MNKIILPLDNKPAIDALKIASKTQGKVWGFKLRRQIFEYGFKVISEFKQYGNVMIDLKFYDIPSAMDEAVKFFIDHCANIVTVHCTAHYKPSSLMIANHVAGVTILTSMREEDFEDVYNVSFDKLDLVVTNMSLFADSQDYGYVVSSPHEVKSIKKMLTNDFRANNTLKLITPGIRPSWYQEIDDQERTMTPKEAIEEGSDLLVIGRPLLNSTDIVGAIEKTNEEIT